MLRKQIVKLSILFPLMMLSATTLAADFVITVPVKLEKLLPETGEAMITCQVLNVDEDILGSGWHKIPLPESTFEGEVKVEVELDYGQSALAASNYLCTLRLRHITGREYILPMSEEEEPEWPIWARGRVGAELVFQVAGELTDEAEDKAKKK
ncbi:MAG: hypothetical protein HUJ30_00820 [Gammaproteobacteria bacterium]|nr:hypothetical protein [Gammaproteobacteria bacterium]